MFQDRGDGAGGLLVKASGVAPGYGRQPQQLHRRASGVSAAGYHRGYHDIVGTPYFHIRRTRGCRRGKPTSLDSLIWLGQCWTLSDFRFNHIVDQKLPSSLGSILSPDVRPPNRSGKTAQRKTFWYLQNLEDMICQVHLGGSRTGGQGGLWDRSHLRGLEASI